MSDGAEVLVFGTGYLAGKFLETLPGSRAVRSDIANAKAVAVELDRARPRVVLNAAGKTGRPNVDWCEDHALETIEANSVGPLVLADACAKREIHLVHLGSGCIYDGDNAGRGFREDDPPNFTDGLYSLSKMVSERALRQCPNVLQLRLRMPTDGAPHPRNLVTKLVKYRNVISIQNSITVLPGFLEAAKALIERRATGVFNMTNPGSITHPEILDLYREIVDPEFTYEVMPLSGLKTRAGRTNCVLNVDKLEREHGIRLPSVETAVRQALEGYRGHARKS